MPKDLTLANLKNPQILAIELLCDPSRTITNKAVAKEVGISEQSFYEWMKKPEFLEALSNRRKQVFRSHMPAIDKALIQTASLADFKATQAQRLAYELAGELDQSDKMKPVTININIPGLVIHVQEG